MSKVDVIYKRIIKITNDLDYYNETINHLISVYDQRLYNDPRTDNLFENIQKLLKIYNSLIDELNEYKELLNYISMLGGDVSCSIDLDPAAEG